MVDICTMHIYNCYILINKRITSKSSMHKGYEQKIHGRSTMNLSTYGNIFNLLTVKIECL